MTPEFINQVLCGDCRQILPTWPANCIDTILTDPPYGTGFMGAEWDTVKETHQIESNNGEDGWGWGGRPGAVSKHFYKAGLAFELWCSEWAAAALRVAKPGALLLAFGGTRTFHRLACGIEDAGWTIVDTIMWTYGQGFPKGLDIGCAIDKAAGAQAKLWEGYNTTLKPAWEPIIVAMKPCEGTYAANALKWGVAGFNIDGGRVAAEGEVVRTRQGQSVSQQAGDMYAGTDQRDGQMFESHRLGRWPANLIHDGSDEVLPSFPQTATGAFDGHRNEPKTKNAYGTFDLVDEPARPGNRGSASRFFYCAKASRAERERGLKGYVPCAVCGQAGSDSHADSRGREVPCYRNIHPTVKPLSLMRYLARLTATPTGGVVLDPFCGSGSTLAACRLEGRGCVGIDLDPKYCDIARHRMGAGEVYP
jgi:site-specific DNA-methyltransferase (adenine-specific)